jgi:hypothetical protein
MSHLTLYVIILCRRNRSKFISEANNWGNNDNVSVKEEEEEEEVEYVTINNIQGSPQQYTL